METLEFERRGHVGWLRLNRPERLNAMNALLWAELADLGPRLRDDPDLRALVVIGNGRAFSSGIDLSSLGSVPNAPDVASVQEGYLWLQEAWYPTVAAVRGYALGAGMQLAVACDLRVAARGARFGMLEANYGLMPDLTGTQLLPRLVGPSKAKELIFTAEQVDAEEALRIGLVNRVVDDGELEDVVGSLASRLAAQPPIAMRWSKLAVDAAGRVPLREGVGFEQRGQAECAGSDDFHEAVTAFREGRLPVYTGR